jgi:hypothetical protein
LLLQQQSLASITSGVTSLVIEQFDSIVAVVVPPIPCPDDDREAEQEPYYSQRSLWNMRVNDYGVTWTGVTSLTVQKPMRPIELQHIITYLPSLTYIHCDIDYIDYPPVYDNVGPLLHSSTLCSVYRIWNSISSEWLATSCMSSLHTIGNIIIRDSRVNIIDELAEAFPTITHIDGINCWYDCDHIPLPVSSLLSFKHLRRISNLELSFRKYEKSVDVCSSDHSFHVIAPYIIDLSIYDIYGRGISLNEFEACNQLRTLQLRVRPDENTMYGSITWKATTVPSSGCTSSLSSASSSSRPFHSKLSQLTSISLYVGHNQLHDRWFPLLSSLELASHPLVARLYILVNHPSLRPIIPLSQLVLDMNATNTLRSVIVNDRRRLQDASFAEHLQPGESVDDILKLQSMGITIKWPVLARDNNHDIDAIHIIQSRRIIGPRIIRFAGHLDYTKTLM